jgi:hypothetical protein
MSLDEFIRDALSQKSEEIDELKDLQKILDETQTSKEEVYMISFAATK